MDLYQPGFAGLGLSLVSGQGCDWLLAPGFLFPQIFLFFDICVCLHLKICRAPKSFRFFKNNSLISLSCSSTSELLKWPSTVFNISQMSLCTTQTAGAAMDSVIPHPGDVWILILNGSWKEEATIYQICNPG